MNDKVPDRSHRLTNTCVGSLYSCDSWKPSLETIKHIRPVFLFNTGYRKGLFVQSWRLFSGITLKC